MNTTDFRPLTAYEIGIVAGGWFNLSPVYALFPGFTHAVAQITGTGAAAAQAAAVPGVVAISLAQAQGFAAGDTAFASATAQA